jgi:hypothetical protein
VVGVQQLPRPTQLGQGQAGAPVWQ